MKLLTVMDVARQVGLNRNAVAQWFRSGRLKTITPHGMLRSYTTQEFLEEFLRPNSGPTDDGDSVQILAERPISTRAARPPKGAKGEWRHGFRSGR